MQDSPSHARAAAARTLLGMAAAFTGVLGVAAAWVALNAWTGSMNGWVALLAAVDAALLLRLSGMHAGAARATIGLAAVVATVLLVGWMTAATEVGFAMGLKPFDSAARMGADLAWTLTRSAASGWDLLAVLLALPLGWWWSR